MGMPRWAALGLMLVAVAQAGEPGPCEPGFKWVEEESFREVERQVCKCVPGKKKGRKVTYRTKPDPFCLRRAFLGCTGPFDRQILVKTVTTCDEPTMRCVVETVVERVPCKTWRKVPCAPAK